MNVVAMPVTVNEVTGEVTTAPAPYMGSGASAVVQACETLVGEKQAKLFWAVGAWNNNGQYGKGQALPALLNEFQADRHVSRFAEKWAGIGEQGGVANKSQFANTWAPILSKGKKLFSLYPHGLVEGYDCEDMATDLRAFGAEQSEATEGGKLLAALQNVIKKYEKIKSSLSAEELAAFVAAADLLVSKI